MPNALNLEGIALNKNQGKWRGLGEKTAAEALVPNAAEVDRGGQCTKASIDAIKRAGLVGLMVPPEMGGHGGDIVTSMLVTEALARGCASTAMCYAMHQST